MMQSSEAPHKAADVDSLEEQNQRLKMLTAELLQTNQELRFKLASLEDEAERQKRGQSNAPLWAGMLF
jgi:hypothetical protein